MAAGRSSACPPCATNHWGSPHRSFGGPLPHPKIRIGDVDGALRHWEDKRRSSSVRGLVLPLHVRPSQPKAPYSPANCYANDAAIDETCDHEPIRAAVAVDPPVVDEIPPASWRIPRSDKRLYITHDTPV